MIATLVTILDHYVRKLVLVLKVNILLSQSVSMRNVWVSVNQSVAVIKRWDSFTNCKVNTEQMKPSEPSGYCVYCVPEQVRILLFHPNTKQYYTFPRDFHNNNYFYNINNQLDATMIVLLII